MVNPSSDLRDEDWDASGRVAKPAENPPDAPDHKPGTADEAHPPDQEVTVEPSGESKFAHATTLLISSSAVAEFVAARPVGEREATREIGAVAVPAAPFARLSARRPTTGSAPPPAPTTAPTPPPTIAPAGDERSKKPVSSPAVGSVSPARATAVSSRRIRIAVWLAAIVALCGAFATGWFFRAELEPLLTAGFWGRLAGQTEHRPGRAPAIDAAPSDRIPTAISERADITTHPPAGNGVTPDDVPPRSAESPAPPASEGPTAVEGNTPARDATPGEPLPRPEVRTDIDAPVSLPEPGPTLEIRTAAEGISSTTGTGSLNTDSPPNPGGAGASNSVTPDDSGAPAAESSLLSAEAGSILPAARPIPAMAGPTDSPVLDDEVIKAQSAVHALVTASNVDTLVPLIFWGESFRETLQSYYETRPFRPLRDTAIERQFDGKVPGTGARAFIFSVVHPDHPRGFPVSAEATPEGYKIDWESYVQWRDEWLRGFIENRPSGPYALFVVLRRTHYFNDDVARLEDRLAFKVTSAVPGDAGTTAFVEARSEAGRSMAESFEWGKIYFPVVELEWVRDEDGGRHVRLNRVVRPTWRRAVTR